MNYYKPYAYLYKLENEEVKLLSCFVILMPAGKALRGPDIFSDDDLTTIEYLVFNDEGQDRDRQEEYENLLEWDGEPHTVRIIVGSGAGSFGGSVTNINNGIE
jgi:hypothetical protein